MKIKALDFLIVSILDHYRIAIPLIFLVIAVGAFMGAKKFSDGVYPWVMWASLILNVFVLLVALWLVFFSKSFVFMTFISGPVLVFLYALVPVVLGIWHFFNKSLMIEYAIFGFFIANVVAVLLFVYFIVTFDLGKLSFG
jgi:hypothetical protein